MAKLTVDSLHEMIDKTAFTKNEVSGEWEEQPVNRYEVVVEARSKDGDTNVFEVAEVSVSKRHGYLVFSIDQPV